MDTDPVRFDRRRRRSRERFLGGKGRADGVRPAIARSWARSKESGVPPDDTPEVPSAEFDPELRLLTLARPVLDRLTDEVQEAEVTVILTDAKGLVLDRRAGSSTLLRGLDRVCLTPGYLYAEATVGTNGIGTSAQQRQPAWIIGSEHYVEWLRWLSCAGVPIRNPITGRIEGILDITCRLQDTNALMLPFVTEGARQIEQRLYEDASESDRALLERFEGVVRRSRHPVVAVNAETVISNAQAAHLLVPADHAHLRSQVREALSAGAGDWSEIRLSSGVVASVRSPLSDSGELEPGVVLELRAEGGERTGRERSERERAKAPPPPPPPGRSLAWQRMVRGAVELDRSALPLAITGEPGSGKLVLARYLHERSRDQGELTVLDAALADVEGQDVWNQGVRSRLRQSGGTLVLRHLEAIRGAGRSALDAILAATEGRAGIRLIATISIPRGEELPGGLPLADHFPGVIHVPPLRERSDDIADLVPALIRRHSPAPGPRFSDEVIRVLARADWPGNVRELEGVVKRMLARRRIGELTLRDLPHEYMRIPGRRLTAMEHAERAAILRALDRSDGNKSLAAAMLGISRVTLYRKLKALGLSAPSSPDGRSR
jgi:sigma-54 dependent transcriptional regulator, acetoin dehydrogenase operon transcriptional activator AcoR